MTSSRTVGALAGLLALVTGLLARSSTLTGEVALAELLNGVPRWAVDWARWVSELGGQAAVVVVAVASAVVAGKRAIRVGLIVLAAGALAWASTLIVKDVVERPRPAAIGADVAVYEGVSTPAWPSTQTAMATAALAAAALAMGRRPGPAIVAGSVVGVSRIVLGVALPLDSVGGVAVGITVAVLVVELAETAPRRVSSAAKAVAG